MSESSNDQEPPVEINPEDDLVDRSSENQSESAQITISEAEWQKVKNEAVENRDKYLRLLAEMENSRKRMLRERQDITVLSSERVIVDFLHPLDNFENALKFAGQMSDEVKNWAVGFQMILDQFKEALTQHGVKSISVVGKEFDPHHHDAIELVETTEFPPGTIIEECTRGYQMGSKTIRPPRVKVAASPAVQEEAAFEDLNNEETE